MSAPFQLTIPENAQVHIHFESRDSSPGPALLPAPAEPAASPRRHLLRLAVWSVLMVGLGYFVRGSDMQSAALTLQGPLAASLDALPPNLTIRPTLPIAASPHIPPAPVPPSSIRLTGPDGTAPPPTASGAPRSPFGLE